MHPFRSACDQGLDWAATRTWCRCKEGQGITVLIFVLSQIFQLFSI